MGAILRLFTGSFGSVLVYATAGLLVLMATGLGVDHGWTIPRLERKVEKTEQERDAEKTGRLADRTVAADAAKKQSEEFRQREQGWQQRVEVTQKEGDAKITRLEGELAARADSERRMRDRVAALVAATRRGPPPPGAPASGPTATEAAGMLADLCERADRRSGVLAEYADRLRISAEACVGAWPVN